MRARRRSRAARPVTALVALALAVTLTVFPAYATPPRALHRRVPDYDGRGGSPPTDASRAVPRALLSPVRALVQYALRAPLGFALAGAERAGLFGNVGHVVGGADPPAQTFPSVAPALELEAGMAPRLGVYSAWDGALARRNSARAVALFGGLANLRFALADAYALAPGIELGGELSYDARFDWVFYGVGPRSEQRDEARYGWARTQGELYLRHRALAHGALEAATGARAERFFSPTLAPAGQPGGALAEDHRVYFGRIAAAVDSRERPSSSAAFARLDGAAEFNTDIDRPARRWARFEASATAAWPVRAHDRVLAARAYIAEIERVGSEPLVLTDLPALGGVTWMRAWHRGRFRGESVIATALTYTFPIWYLLDAELFLEAGNAFGPRLSGFSPALLHGDVGLTVRSTSRALELTVALGSGRFDAPFTVESARVAVGLYRGP